MSANVTPLSLAAIVLMSCALQGQGPQAAWNDPERDLLAFPTLHPALEWSGSKPTIPEDRLLRDDLAPVREFDDLPFFPKTWGSFASWMSPEQPGGYINQYHLSVANMDGTGPVRISSVHGWSYGRIVTTMSIAPDPTDPAHPWWRLRQTFAGWGAHDSDGNDEPNQANHPVNFFTPKNDFWGSVEETVGSDRVEIRIATQATNFFREGNGPTRREFRRTSALISIEKGGRVVVLLPDAERLGSSIRTYLFGRPGDFEEDELKPEELKNPYRPFSRIVPMANSRTGAMPFQAVQFPFDMSIGSNWKPIDGKRPPARPITENGTQYRYTVGTYLHLRPTKATKTPTGDVIIRNPKGGMRYGYTVWVCTPWGTEVNLGNLGDVVPPGLFGEDEVVTMMLRDGMPPHPGFSGSVREGFAPFSTKPAKEFALKVNDFEGR